MGRKRNKRQWRAGQMLCVRCLQHVAECADPRKRGRAAQWCHYCWTELAPGLMTEIHEEEFERFGIPVRPSHQEVGNG